ncbi:MAG: metalloprotease [Nanoarchaeota archaeon]
MHTSLFEIRELAKAWFAISIAFTILLRGTELGIVSTFFLSLLTVGLGFLLHELAHKIVAQHYGCHAEFRANNGMLSLAIFLSFIGFIFAAPGAVMIKGFLTKRENGLISVAGPLTNLILAFLLLPLSFMDGLLGAIGSYGFIINSWLGLFNMIPMLPLDGAKVWKWNRGVYITVALVLLVMVLLGF